MKTIHIALALMLALVLVAPAVNAQTEFKAYGRADDLTASEVDTFSVSIAKFENLAWFITADSSMAADLSFKYRPIGTSKYVTYTDSVIITAAGGAAGRTLRGYGVVNITPAGAELLAIVSKRASAIGGATKAYTLYIAGDRRTN